MNKMIGKSGINWSKAPEGTTHYKHSLFYRQHTGVWEYHNNYWLKSSNVDSWFNDAVSKEEDLQMSTKEVSKQVSSIKDVPEGWFIKWQKPNTSKCQIYVKGMFHCFLIKDDYQVSGVERVDFSGFDYHSHYSETYSGEYTPIVKETEAERKIKELEATIALAQKQLQEYKEMK